MLKIIIIIIVIFIKRLFGCRLASFHPSLMQKPRVLWLFASLPLVFPTVSPESLCDFLQGLSLHL